MSRKTSVCCQQGVSRMADLHSPRNTCAARQNSARVTDHLLELINAECGFGPISRQFIPTADELLSTPIDREDPIGDARFSPVPGVVHRYPDRLLLLLCHSCSAYCRFCFRRNMLRTGNGAMSPKDLQVALEYIRSHQDIWEVILSGGDPFSLSDRYIAYVMTALKQIEHVEIVRIHTRTPVSDPDRITSSLVRALSNVGKPVYVVLHCNHAEELHDKTRRACASFIDAGIMMLSQTVLLRGVNDNIGTLSTLMRELVKSRIKPYYLHHVDLAHGTGHFRTTVKRGQTLMRKLQANLSGLCQPLYVLDIPGGHGKIPIGPNYIHYDENRECHIVKDHDGNEHVYPSE